MQFIDKGTHFGTAVAFTTSQATDGTWIGDIRTDDGKDGRIKNYQMYSPMADTMKKDATRDGLIAKLEADLAEMIA